MVSAVPTIGSVTLIVVPATRLTDRIIRASAADRLAIQIDAIIATRFEKHSNVPARGDKSYISFLKKQHSKRIELTWMPFFAMSVEFVTSFTY
jgi:hypothetical protein